MAKNCLVPFHFLTNKGKLGHDKCDLNNRSMGLILTIDLDLGFEFQIFKFPSLYLNFFLEFVLLSTSICVSLEMN